MSTLVIDIETVGEKFDAMDDVTQHNLTRWIERESRDDAEYEARLKDVKEGLGFSPLTGEVVAIGMLDVEKDAKVVYFQAPGEEFGRFEEEGVTYEQLTEAQMLLKFWNGAQKYNELVTFNGRGFDLPFLVTRSAVQGIRPSKDFLSNRYLSSQRFDAKHIDLQDQLSFYGAVMRKGSLHLWCRAFGIESPKAGGVTGDDVRELFEAKRYKDIARYNVRDIVATRDLFVKWEKYIR